MAHSPLHSRRRGEIGESDQREWNLKGRMISRENTKSRRFSSSYITSFREDSRSFRSNITICSTASSPGYNLKEEIDPSTYSFTSAVRALQARSVNTWECLSPEGFALNSKWNEAEKYICNPLSGEIPLECLSARTLNGRSFRNLTSRITMSAPLIYPSSRFNQTTTNSCFSIYEQESKIQNVINEMKMGNMFTRDAGVRSTSPDLTSNTATATSLDSSSQMDKSTLKSNATEEGNSPSFTPKSNLKEVEVGVKGRDEEDKEEIIVKKKGEKKGKVGCISMSCLWRRRHEEKEYKQHIPRKQKKNIFPLPC